LRDARPRCCYACLCSPRQRPARVEGRDAP
jgi:hypothetical protein